MMTLTVTFKDPSDAQRFKVALDEINAKNYERKKQVLGEDVALGQAPIYSGIKLRGYNVSCSIPSEVYATTVMPLVRTSAVAINF